MVVQIFSASIYHHLVPTRWSLLLYTISICRLRLTYNGTRAENRFRLSAKQTSPFKSAGASVQSTTGRRAVRISGSNAGYTMFRGSVRELATHSIRQFPLHFPSRASPSAITFQLDSTMNVRLYIINKLEHQTAFASLVFLFALDLPNFKNESNNFKEKFSLFVRLFDNILQDCLLSALRLDTHVSWKFHRLTLLEGAILLITEL